MLSALIVYVLNNYTTGPTREIVQGGTRLLLGSRGQVETALKIEDFK